MASSHETCGFLWSETPDEVARVRELFARIGYHREGIGRLLGIDPGHRLSQHDLPALLQRTEQGGPLDTLVRLLLVGVPVAEAAAREALQPMALEDWLAAGLLALGNGQVRGCVKLVPFEDLFLAYDLPPWMEGGRHDDYVMGVGSSSLTLARVTVRRPAARTLDLGTGCGVLALLAAAHSGRVVAVDRNPRAVAFAAFNARLGGLDHVDCRVGDLFRGLEEERFDLVVCNPPFVVSPEATYIYRDGGAPGDGLVHRIVREVPAVLAEGGFCQMLCNWAHVAGQDWRERLAGWVAGTGCDAWVLRTDTFGPADYADKWIRHTERDTPESYSQRHAAWMDYYRREGIEAISGGFLFLRRRTGGNWFRASDGPERILEEAGEDVALAFTQRDFLEAHRDDQDLLRRCLRLSPRASLHQVLRPAAGGWQPAECTLRLERGLAYSGRVDPFMSELLGRCDGRTSLNQLLERMARALGRPRAVVAPALLTVVRSLLEQGFLLG